MRKLNFNVTENDSDDFVHDMNDRVTVYKNLKELLEHENVDQEIIDICSSEIVKFQSLLTKLGILK